MSDPSTTDSERQECDRCGTEFGALEPVTNIQFSGGVDALRTACADCIEDLVDTWNEGDAV
ncbi:hypothetical protein [Salinarchaeum laminariae]|uniref:hypothetical protein n=1 Tax=Salinarchaeum laminariae TaxID=869888 RepID=UPI0020C06515|nr:hypothetical protein [Salinarchaeum laminariae]